jgi:DNA repair exonuclease SbcCD ATPase subunit
MKRKGLFAAACALVVTMAPGIAGADRLTDQQVKSLLEQVDKNFDRWKNGLERANMDEAVIRSAAGTIDVKQFLKGFEDDIDRARDKFKAESAAIPEITNVLRKGSDVERRYKQRSGAAGSEWQALSNSLASLAAAYGVPQWPIESLDTQLIRVNDKDLAARLQGTQRMAKQLASEAGKVKAAPQADREAVKADAKQMENVIKDLASRIKSGKPASAEAKTFLQLIQTTKPKVTALTGLSTPGQTAWSQIEQAGLTIALAFGSR